MTTFETWRPVVGYEDRYEVSDLGRVRSLPRHGSSGGFLTAPISTGRCSYRRVSLSRGGVSRPFKVHRLVCEAFHGPGTGLSALHRDDDSLNNLADNLYWGSQSDNMWDKVRNGRHHLADRTHCKHGHEFTPENTGRRSNGSRRCRVCNARQTAERRTRG